MRVISEIVKLPDGALQSVARVHGLDFAAAIALAEGMGAANFLFFDLLPEIEAIIVRSYRGDTES